MGLPAIPPSVPPVARQLQATMALCALAKRQERACFLGKLLCLISEGELALYLGNRALEALNQPRLPSVYGWAAFAVPSILMLGEAVLPPGYTKATVGFLKNQLGLVLRTAVVVSQIAVVYFTGQVAAIVVLSYMAIDALHSRQLLPAPVSKGFSWLQFPLFLTSGILAAGSWEGAAWYMATFVAHYAVPKILLWKFGAETDPEENTGRLTPEILNDILTKKNPEDDFEPSIGHLTWAPLPREPNVEFSELLSLCDGIAWDKWWPQLAELANDPDRPNPDPRFPQRIIPAQRQTQDIRKRIEEIVQLGPKLELLTIYRMKVVINHLKRNASEEVRAQFLFDLVNKRSLEFRWPFIDYCERFVDRTDANWFRNAILHRLQEIRTEQGSRVVNQITQVLGTLGISKFQKFTPVFQNFIGGMFGHILKKDHIRIPETWFWGMWFQFKDAMKETLAISEYDVHNLVQRTKHFSQESAVRMQSWWHSFVGQQPITTQRQFRRLLAKEKLQKSVHHWNHDMKFRWDQIEHVSQNPKLKKQKWVWEQLRQRPALPSPSEVVEALDLTHVKPRSSLLHNVQPTRNFLVADVDNRISSVEITDKLVLAMLFEMGIVDRKPILPAVPSVPFKPPVFAPLSRALRAKLPKPKARGSLPTDISHLGEPTAPKIIPDEIRDQIESLEACLSSGALTADERVDIEAGLIQLRSSVVRTPVPSSKHVSIVSVNLNDHPD